MSAFDIILSVVGFVLTIANGWLVVWVKRFEDDVNDLRKADQQVGDQVNQIRLLVAGDCITREEFRGAVKEFRDDFKGALTAQTEVLLRNLKDAMANLRFRSNRDDQGN